MLVPVLVTNGGGGKLLDRSFRVLEDKSKCLLRSKFLNHLNVSDFGEGNLHLSGHRLRVRNGLIYRVLFYLFEGHILLDCTGADFRNFLVDNLGDLTRLRDLYKIRFLVLLVNGVLLWHLDRGLTADDFGNSASHCLCASLLFSSLSEHLDGLVLFRGLAAFATIARGRLEHGTAAAVRRSRLAPAFVGVIDRALILRRYLYRGHSRRSNPFRCGYFFGFCVKFDHGLVNYFRDHPNALNTPNRWSVLSLVILVLFILHLSHWLLHIHSELFSRDDILRSGN